MGIMRRRWLWPAVVLLVGGAIAFWAAQRETRRMHAIERQVLDICGALGEDRDVTGTLNRANPVVERKTIQALRGVVNSPDTASAIRVRVTPGDSDLAGPSAIRATHTAMIMLGEDEELLGLRIHCDDPAAPITILGYWTPSSN